MNEIIDQYFDLSQMSKHFGEVFEGFVITLEIAVIAVVLALIWGLILALLRQLPGRGLLPVRFLTIAYIDVFRGIPLLILILLISGSLRSSHPARSPSRIPEQWFGKPDNFWYAIMALTLTYGAYMAEVYRAGIEAVPHGQMEAARSLGMSHGQAMRNVIVPQAVRKVIAPMLNEFIALLKDTTLVSVIALNEVALVGRDIQSKTFNSSALTLGALMFLVIILPLARLVDWLIAREQGSAPGAGPRSGRSSPRASWPRAEPMLKLEGSTSASATSRCCAGSTSRSPAAKSSACSARAAPARAPCCAASTCSSRPRRARSSSRATTSARAQAPAPESQAGSSTSSASGSGSSSSSSTSSPQHGARERDDGAGKGAQAPAGGGPRKGGRAAREGGADRQARRVPRTALRAASSSASRSRGRWRWTRT